MLRGITISAILHGALLAWALVTFHATAPLRMPEPEPVEVAIITEGDLVRLRQGDRNSKQLEARVEEKQNPDTQQPEAKKQKPPPPPPTPPPPPPKAEAPPEPPKEAKAEPPPEPPKDNIADKIAELPPEEVGPTPEELARKEAEKKAEQKRIEDQKKAEAEKKRKEELKKKEDERKRLAELKRKEEEKKKKEFDASRIAALIDKSPDPRGAPPAAPANTAPQSKAKGPTAGAPEGKDSVLTASQRSMIGIMMRQAVSRCWNINAGAQGIEKIVVRVEVMLGRDGRLSGTPKVVNSMAGPLFADAANSALRALAQCEPYDLPAELYEGGWDYMIVTFDPQAMFR